MIGGAVFGGGGLEAAGSAGEVVGEDAELGGPAGPHGVEPVEQGGVAQGGPAEGDGREQAAGDRTDLVGAGLEPSGGSFQLARITSSSAIHLTPSPARGSWRRQ